MFLVGDKIIYGENGVCTVECIAPLPMSGSSKDKLYYHLTPYIGTGTYYAPVDSPAFMRPVMDRSQAEAFISTIPDIAPAICNDNRFNHVDTFYKNLFKEHTCEALVSVIKGLRLRASDRKTKSSRAEATLKRARDILYGELSIALDLELEEIEKLVGVLF